MRAPPTYCEHCGLKADLYVMAQRDDKSWYEKKDGTIAGSNDIFCCVDCCEELEESRPAMNELP